MKFLDPFGYHCWSMNDQDCGFTQNCPSSIIVIVLMRSIGPWPTLGLIVLMRSIGHCPTLGMIVLMRSIGHCQCWLFLLMRSIGYCATLCVRTNHLCSVYSAFRGWLETVSAGARSRTGGLRLSEGYRHVIAYNLFSCCEEKQIPN